MSGDVQPRKRKDKKRKKDELGVEEPRGTAAVFGEGDVFMHSQHEHGTGGHWCAKVIFFSLLAVLVTLIGLIILENRGLTDLEANSVETRYSGVLEGWIEDVPHNGHHDEHTLELKHDDVGGHDDDDEPSQEIDQDDEEDHADEHEEADDHDDEVDQDDDQSDEDDREDDSDANDSGEDDDNSEEKNLEDADEEDYEEPAYKRYVRSAEYQQGDGDDDDDEDNDDDLQKVDENDSTEDNDENDQDDEKDESLEQDDDNDQSVEEIDDDIEQSAEEGDNDKERTVGADNESYEDDDDNDGGNDSANDDESKEDADNSNEDENYTREDEDEEEHDDDEGDSGVEVEKLEKEISDEDALSTEEPEQLEAKDEDRSQEDSNEATPDDVDDEEEYLELDDIDEPPPVVEHIKVPAGKPLAEVEEDSTSEKPQDTLAEEEEYEKQQEELRREKAEASHMWLKLVVGGALLAATHAVVRRATAPRDAPDDHAIREETPAIDRRMTLIPEEAAAPATPTEVLEEPEIEEEILEDISSVIQSAPVEPESEEDDDEDIEEIEIESKEVTAEPVKDTVDKELYSDEEEYDDEDEEEEIIDEKNEPPKQSAPVTRKAVAPEPEPEPDPEEEVPDDVEIIEDEPLEEELEEEEEDDISDVDDAELLSRLEAKYGRIPEPERPGQKHKDGGNSIEDDWPGEPSDAYWRQQLDQAEQELRQGEWSSAERRVSAAELRGSARGRWLAARALDASAEARRDNTLLSRAIAAYLDLLKMNDRLSDNILHQITNRTLDRIRFRGSYLTAEPVYRLLIRRFPHVPDYHNNLTITYLMANRADLAEESIKETLKRWPDDRVALAHYGFVLKTQHNRLEEAVDAFQRALKDDVGPATEPRFYYHLGDSLLLLGRFAEAHEVHKRGAALGHFLSPAQRSLYNVDRLKSRPWWTIEQTPYSKLARALEKSWKEILKEGEAARALYEKEKEGLKERGEWSQLDLFVRGQEVPERCKRAPVTCSIVRSEPAAIGCRRGQVKFSSMEAGTHVRPHVGPTNCRLRMHLGLSNTKDTYIRVDQETRQWQAGKVLMFDDSFEHEVWHNGTGARLVLIVDVWHPDLTPAERRALPAI